MALDMCDREVECEFGRGRECLIFAEHFAWIGTWGTTGDQRDRIASA
jgi:hypothetical protein